MSVEIIQSSPECIAVRGQLVFETARRAHELGIRIISEASGGEIKVDCAGITRADSAGLVVMLDWLAVTRRRGMAMHFVGVPERVQAVARISEIDELLNS